MELLKDTAMEAAWFVWASRPTEPSLTVVVKATYDLPAEGVCTLADEQRLPTGDTHTEDDVDLGLAWGSDMEPLKPRGEFFVVGHVHAVAPVAETMAIARVGGVEKSVVVTGDRGWRLGRPTQAATFSKMPLGWERCFGGPGHEENPIGRGLSADPTSGQLMLPNFEDPRATIASGVDRPRTHGLSPRTRAWAPRARYAGTHDARWREESYPGFAADLDYRLFLCAPPDQWIDGFFRGDEPIELASLHPAFPRVHAQLPGHAAQAFTIDARGGLTDVGLRLDTIAIDADAGQVVCVWRGLTSLRRGAIEGALEPIERLFVVHQEPGDRHALADYEAWYRRALAAAGDEPTVERAGTRSAASSSGPLPLAPATTSAAVTPMMGDVAAEIARRMQEAGVDTKPEQIVVEPDAPGAKWAHLDQALTVRGDDAPLAASVAAEIARRREEERSRAFRPVFEDALGIAAPTEDDAPALSAEEQLELEMQLALGDLDEPESSDRARVREALARGESCEGWELVGADLSGLDLSDADFRGAVLTRANLSGVSARRAQFDGASLAECELSDASFEEVSFHRAVLSPIRAERVRFVACRFESATVSESYLRNARFMRCRFGGSDFTASDLSEAFFDECVLDGADLSECVLESARFTRSSLVDAWLEGARAARAVFDGCDCSLIRLSDGAVLEGASFRRAKLDGARFNRSKLRAANFSLASLSRADFTEALLAQVQLVGCVLREARMSKAVLVQASLLRSDLHQVQLDGANLKHADLRGTNLFQAELLGANLEGARLDLSDTTGTRIA